MNCICTPMNRKVLRKKMAIENIKLLLYERLTIFFWDLAFYLDLQGVKFKNKALTSSSKKRTYLSLIDKLDIYEHRRAFKRAVMVHDKPDLYPIDIKDSLWLKK